MLDRTLNQIILERASVRAPGFTLHNNAPGTFQDINSAHASTGRLVIWPGASERTIYGDASVNHAARAWHDWHHIAGAHDFTLPGEIETMQAQCRDLFDAHGNNAYTRYVARVLEIEVAGQARHFATYGAFPTDQLAFTKGELER